MLQRSFFGVKEQNSYSRVNGLDAVTISLANDNQANLINLSHAAVNQVNELNKTLAAEGSRDCRPEQHLRDNGKKY